MSSKQKFTKNLIKLISLSVLLYLTLFYIAPFVSELIARVFNFNTQVVAPTRLNAPTLLNFPEVTNKNEIDVTGVASADVSVELFLNDSSYGKITADTEGKFKFERVNIIKGLNKISLSSKNKDGVESPKSKEYVLDFDDKKPEIKDINLSNGKVIENLNNNIVILGETSEYSDIEVNGKKVFKKDGNKFEYLLGVSEGNVSINIKLTDKAGNETKLTYNVVYKRN